MKFPQGILSWLITILTPIVLMLTAVRLLLTPAFIWLEYHTPSFPPDPFGFTLQDRLYWSQVSLDYLLNDEDISFFGDLQLDNSVPLYNDRELKHMVDVKNVVQSALKVEYTSVGLIVAVGVWAWFGGWRREFSRAMWRGGWLTVILVGLTIMLVLLSFGFFFVAFHEVFFDPGTWMFAYSDTLIRLFPERFWRDTFLAAGLLTIVGGLACAFGFRPKTLD